MSIEETPGKKEILFTWFNHYAGITVKTPSKNIIIDPVDVKPKRFQQVDAILITHEHYDHFDQAVIAEIFRSTKCSVIADLTSAKRLENTISERKLTAVRPGSEVNLDDVAVNVEKCNHPPATSPVSYLITSEDGVKIFHTADSLPFPEMIEIGEKDKPDVAFCTVGIAPGASPEKAVDIARLAKPQVAVPYHTNSVENQMKFEKLLKKELPKMNCLIPELGKIYQVSRRT